MKKYIIFSVILVALISYNLLYRHNSAAGVFLSIIYIFYFGRRLGNLAFPNFNQFWHRLLGPLLLLAGLIICGTIIYYFYALTDYVVIILLVLLPIALIPYCQIKKKDINVWEGGHLEPVPLVEPNGQALNFWSWLIMAGDLYLFYYLIIHASAEAMRSPWIFVSYKFFIAFFFFFLILVIYLKKTQSSLRSLFVLFVHVLLMVSVALIIYKLGYGFDPILHRASEQYIAQFGSIVPKTPYYLGQYVLVVLLSKISGLSLFFIDKTILILLEAIFLPILVFISLHHGLNWDRTEARLGSLLFFGLPFTYMAATTPQGLANFFALTAILFGIIYLKTTLIKWWVVPTLTLTTIFIHPLIGLPAAFFCVLMFLLKWRDLQTKKVWAQILAELFIFLFFFVSLAIITYIFVKYLGASFNLPNWADIFKQLPQMPWPRAEQNLSWILTPLYLYNHTLPLLVIVLSLGGVIALLKNKEKNVVALLGLTYIIFIVNAALLKFMLTFANIGESEQGQYAERLYSFSFYLLFPLALGGFFLLLKKIKKYNSVLTFAVICSIIITASFYLSYPRVDAYELSHYINTSVHDFKTAHTIEDNSRGQPYIVLSNISFSAAAIQEFGFRNYYKTPSGEIFYYSLPTGGALYHYFEKMSYIGANKKTMQEAMDLVGVKQGYFVLNDYWDSFKKALPQTQASADEQWQVDGKVFVFKYNR